MVYMYHSFLIHSSADGHLGCFHVLARINSAVMIYILNQLVWLVLLPQRHRPVLNECFLSLFEGRGEGPMQIL